jgi:hypothetical protein
VLITGAAISALPAPEVVVDDYTLVYPFRRNAIAYRCDPADDFVAHRDRRNAEVEQATPEVQFGVAHSRRRNLYKNLAGFGFTPFNLLQSKRLSRSMVPYRLHRTAIVPTKRQQLVACKVVSLPARAHPSIMPRMHELAKAISLRMSVEGT